jgi:hypothetical protein
MARLIPTKAPNLLLAPNQYQAIYHEQMNNALRLYFSRIDSTTSALLGPLGAHFLNAPHISASSSADQFALGDNTPTLVAWDSVDTNAGFTLDPGGYAITPVSGTYKIDYSLQLINTDNVAHDVYVWLQVNGSPLTNSSRRFTVPARVSSVKFSHLVAYSSIVFTALGGDEIRLWWATEKAATLGGVAGVYMEHFPAQTSPYVAPANPSAIGSITFVSCPCDLTV